METAVGLFSEVERVAPGKMAGFGDFLFKFAGKIIFFDG